MYASVIFSVVIVVLLLAWRAFVVLVGLADVIHDYTLFGIHNQGFHADFPLRG
jgi:hypothetical protein